MQSCGQSPQGTVDEMTAGLGSLDSQSRLGGLDLLEGLLFQACPKETVLTAYCSWGHMQTPAVSCCEWSCRSMLALTSLLATVIAKI